MKFLKNYKEIEILASSPYFPYARINEELIEYHSLQQELLRVKKIVSIQPLPYYSYDRSYLLRVAKLFGVKLTFCSTTRKSELRGFCLPQENRIQVSLKKDHSYNKRTLTHEIGHILQLKFGLMEEQETIYLSTELKSEQQAETISYYLCKILWPKQRFDKGSFNCYFDEEDILWLDNFYRKQKSVPYINDLFKLKTDGKKKSR
jgi:hypothetical protein